MVDNNKEIDDLERYLWNNFLWVDLKKLYAEWEEQCDYCIELMEQQNEFERKGDLCDYFDVLFRARIARIEGLRYSLRRRFVRVGVSVPALSKNTPVNSIVQAIHGREIGLKKRHTNELSSYLNKQNFGGFNGMEPFETPPPMPPPPPLLSRSPSPELPYDPSIIIRQDFNFDELGEF